MMTTNKLTAKAGDVVIYCRKYGARPEKMKVSRATAAGWIQLAEFGKTTFKPDGDSWYVGKKADYAGRAYPWSQEAWDRFEAEAADRKFRDEIEEETRQRAIFDRNERRAKELAAVTAAVGGSLDACIAFRQTMPNGDRLVVLNLPVRPECQVRKGATETLVVKLRDRVAASYAGTDVILSEYVESRDNHMRVVTEASMTYTNSDTSSFSSISAEVYDCDEAALWSAARDRYSAW